MSFRPCTDRFLFMYCVCNSDTKLLKAKLQLALDLMAAEPSIGCYLQHESFLHWPCKNGIWICVTVQTYAMSVKFKILVHHKAIISVRGNLRYRVIHAHYSSSGVPGSARVPITPWTPRKKILREETSNQVSVTSFRRDSHEPPYHLRSCPTRGCNSFSEPWGNHEQLNIFGCIFWTTLKTMIIKLKLTSLWTLMCFSSPLPKKKPIFM